MIIFPNVDYQNNAFKKISINIFLNLIVLGLKDTIDEIQRDIGQRMYETCLRGNLPDAKDLLSRDDMVKLKRCIFAQGK